MGNNCKACISIKNCCFEESKTSKAEEEINNILLQESNNLLNNKNNKSFNNQKQSNKNLRLNLCLNEVNGESSNSNKLNMFNINLNLNINHMSSTNANQEESSKSSRIINKVLSLSNDNELNVNNVNDTDNANNKNVCNINNDKDVKTKKSLSAGKIRNIKLRLNHDNSNLISHNNDYIDSPNMEISLRIPNKRNENNHTNSKIRNSISNNNSNRYFINTNNSHDMSVNNKSNNYLDNLFYKQKKLISQYASRKSLLGISNPSNVSHSHHFTNNTGVTAKKNVFEDSHVVNKKDSSSSLDNCRIVSFDKNSSCAEFSEKNSEINNAAYIQNKNDFLNYNSLNCQDGNNRINNLSMLKSKIAENNLNVNNTNFSNNANNTISKKSLIENDRHSSLNTNNKYSNNSSNANHITFQKKSSKISQDTSTSRLNKTNKTNNSRPGHKEIEKGIAVLNFSSLNTDVLGSIKDMINNYFPNLFLSDQDFNFLISNGVFLKLDANISLKKKVFYEKKFIVIMEGRLSLIKKDSVIAVYSKEDIFGDFSVKDIREEEYLKTNSKKNEALLNKLTNDTNEKEQFKDDTLISDKFPYLKSDSSTLLCIFCSKNLNYLLNIQKEESTNKVRILKQIPMLNLVNIEVLKEISTRITYENHNSNKVLLRVNDLPDKIYYVINGALSWKKDYKNEVIYKKNEIIFNELLLCNSLIPNNRFLITTEATDLAVLKISELKDLLGNEFKKNILIDVFLKIVDTNFLMQKIVLALHLQTNSIKNLSSISSNNISNLNSSKILNNVGSFSGFAPTEQSSNKENVSDQMSIRKVSHSKNQQNSNNTNNIINNNHSSSNFFRFNTGNLRNNNNNSFNNNNKSSFQGNKNNDDFKNNIGVNIDNQSNPSPNYKSKLVLYNKNTVNNSKNNSLILEVEDDVNFDSNNLVQIKVTKDLNYENKDYNINARSSINNDAIENNNKEKERIWNNKLVFKSNNNKSLSPVKSNQICTNELILIDKATKSDNEEETNSNILSIKNRGLSEHSNGLNNNQSQLINLRQPNNKLLTKKTTTFSSHTNKSINKRNIKNTKFAISPLKENFLRRANPSLTTNLINTKNLNNNYNRDTNFCRLNTNNTNNTNSNINNEVIESNNTEEDFFSSTDVYSNVINKLLKIFKLMFCGKMTDWKIKNSELEFNSVTDTNTLFESNIISSSKNNFDDNKEKVLEAIGQEGDISKSKSKKKLSKNKDYLNEENILIVLNKPSVSNILRSSSSRINNNILSSSKKNLTTNYNLIELYLTIPEKFIKEQGICNVYKQKSKSNKLVKEQKAKDSDCSSYCSNLIMFYAPVSLLKAHFPFFTDKGLSELKDSFNNLTENKILFDIAVKYLPWLELLDAKTQKNISNYLKIDTITINDKIKQRNEELNELIIVLDDRFIDLDLKKALNNCYSMKNEIIETDSNVNNAYNADNFSTDKNINDNNCLEKNLLKDIETIKEINYFGLLNLLFNNDKASMEKYLIGNIGIPDDIVSKSYLKNSNIILKDIDAEFIKIISLIRKGFILEKAKLTGEVILEKISETSLLNTNIGNTNKLAIMRIPFKCFNINSNDTITNANININTNNNDKNSKSNKTIRSKVVNKKVFSYNLINFILLNYFYVKAIAGKALLKNNIIKNNELAGIIGDGKINLDNINIIYNNTNYNSNINYNLSDNKSSNSNVLNRLITESDKIKLLIDLHTSFLKANKSKNISNNNYNNYATDNELNLEEESSLKCFYEINYEGVNIKNLYIIMKLGEGSFGKVFLVKYNSRFYAMKVLYHKFLLKSKLLIKSFEEELINMNNKYSPFIPKIKSFFYDLERVFLLMTCSSPITLRHLIVSNSEYFCNSKLILVYLFNLLIAVEHIHNENIIHRDIKPHNIIVKEDGYLELIDFGISKKIKDFTNTITGTPYYMASEVIQGTNYGYSCDIWSIGIVAYEMLIGNNPFMNDNDYNIMEIYKRILNIKLNTDVDRILEQKKTFSNNNFYIHLDYDNISNKNIKSKSRISVSPTKTSKTNKTNNNNIDNRNKDDYFNSKSSKKVMKSTTTKQKNTLKMKSQDFHAYNTNEYNRLLSDVFKEILNKKVTNRSNSTTLLNFNKKLQEEIRSLSYTFPCELIKIIKHEYLSLLGIKDLYNSYYGSINTKNDDFSSLSCQAIDIYNHRDVKQSFEQLFHGNFKINNLDKIEKSSIHYMLNNNTTENNDWTSSHVKEGYEFWLNNNFKNII